MPSNDLLDFLESAAKEIKSEYNRIQKRVREDPGTAGDQGEENWATLLKEWLPSNLHIVIKGRILDSSGNTSPQVDVIILKPEYPKRLLDKKLYLAGGVLAAFECKLTLRAQHITEFMKNSAIIKKLTEKQIGSPYKELQSPIIYGLLAHSQALYVKKALAVDKIGRLVKEEDKRLITHPIQMPDILCVGDLACWVAHKQVYVGPMNCENWAEVWGDSNGQVTTSYLQFPNQFQNEGDSTNPISILINSLFSKLSYEIVGLRPIAEYFVRSRTRGVGMGYSRIWERTVYSEETNNSIDAGKVKNWYSWDEWSHTLY